MSRHARQRGMSIVVAIFLIVVIASLAAFAVSVGSAQASATNLQLQADRALSAARAGAEWGAYRARVQQVCTGPTLVNPPLQGALLGFRVTVRCTRTGFLTEGPLTYRVYDIDADAQWSNFGAANYSYRGISTRVIGP